MFVAIVGSSLLNAGFLLLQSVGSVSHGLSCPAACGNLPGSGIKPVSCIVMRILNQGSPMPVFWKSISDLPQAHRCIVLLLWPLLFLEVKTLVWTNVPNEISLAVWQQSGWLKLLYRGPSILAIFGIWGTPISRFYEELGPWGFICEGTAPSYVFFVGAGSALWA